MAQPGAGAGGIGLWDWDMVNDTVKCSTSFIALYGREPGSPLRYRIGNSAFTPRNAKNRSSITPVCWRGRMNTTANSDASGRMAASIGSTPGQRCIAMNQAARCAPWERTSMSAG